MVKTGSQVADLLETPPVLVQGHLAGPVLEAVVSYLPIIFVMLRFLKRIYRLLPDCFLS